MIDPKLEQEINLLHDRICHALADPKRVLILYVLSQGSRCVHELVDELNLPQSTVSRHLRVLRERELVCTERQGTAMSYTLADRRIIEALDLLREILAAQLAASVDLAQALQ